MKYITYKEFIDISKYVKNFSRMGFKNKILFYLKAPFKYKKFKNNHKKEIKIEKKEVN